MAVGNNASVLAGQLEKVHSSDIEDLFQLDSVLWKYFKARPKDEVSTRPERIPYEVGIGIKSRASSFDGQDLGRGGAPDYTYGNVAPVSFSWNLEWTKLADVATDNREKAVFNYMTERLKKHSAAAAFNIDSLISYGDGSNTLGVVTSYDNVNYIIYVDNAARFYRGQDVDGYNSGLGTTLTAVYTLSGVDARAKALYLGAAPSVAPTAGALLLENNSPGTANSGLNGILAYQSALTTGTYTGVSRAAYPGSFTTPNVNAGNATLTPQIARLMLAQLKLARGTATTPGNNVKLHMGLDQQTAWENTGINVTQNIQGGNATARDMLAPEAVSTMGGIPIIVNIKAIPGRIDLLDFDTWYRIETAPLDFYEVGTNRVFPIYGASGGIASAMISYMMWIGNIVCSNTLRNAFISGLAIPTSY